MKTFVKIILVAIISLGVSRTFAQNNSDLKSVTISAVMHCNSCVQKIEKNIPFEKGVKDIKINFDKQEVKVDYDSKKTNPEELLKAFKKIKIEAKLPTAKK